MKITFSFILLVFLLSGCSTVNNVDKETYESLKTGIQILNTEFLEYVKNDKNISERSKLTINTKVKAVTESFKNLKAQE